MKQFILFLAMLFVGVANAATVVIPADGRAVSVSGATVSLAVIDASLATATETVYSSPINIAGLALQELDSLGQKSNIDFRIGTVVAVCKDLSDTATVVDSVNTAVFVEALDASFDVAGIPSSSDGWYAVDSMKVLGNGDAGAKVKRIKAMKLATEAPTFLRFKLVGLSGLAYAKPRCLVYWTRKDWK